MWWVGLGLGVVIWWEVCGDLDWYRMLRFGLRSGVKVWAWVGCGREWLCVCIGAQANSPNKQPTLNTL